MPGWCRRFCATQRAWGPRCDDQCIPGLLALIAVQLKLLQRGGYFIALDKVPVVLIKHKVIKYSQLVANMVILHNVQWMPRKLKELQARGYPVDEPVLKALSPYRTSHINRFGDYTLDLTRAVEPIDYKIKFS